MSIKPKHLLSLLQTGFTTIQVQFPADLPQGEVTASRHDRNSGQTVVGKVKDYTYKIMGPCSPGDTVVVDSPYSGLTCVKVISVDETPRIDLGADFTYKWVVQRVDTSAYKEMLEKEEAFTSQVEEVQRINQRDQLLRQYADAFPAGSPARDAFDKALKDFNPQLANSLTPIDQAVG